MHSVEQNIEPPSTTLRLLIAAAKEKTERQDLLDSLICREEVGCALTSRGYSVVDLDVTPHGLDNPSSLFLRVANFQDVCIFNLFEGFGSQPCQEADFCELLEKKGIPFTGNPSHVLRLCLDKWALKLRLRQEGISVPWGICITSSYSSISMGEKKWPFPLFIKPSREDGSVGIDETSLVQNYEELQEQFQKKLPQFPDGLLVEEFLGGSEYSIAFLGNDPYEVVGVSTLDYDRYPALTPFLTYKAKWDKESPDWRLCPEDLELPAAQKELIIGTGAKAAAIAGCKGYFRVDLREKDGHFYVIDVNPNPALTRDSGFARQYTKGGRSYEDLICHIVNLALKDHIKEAKS